MHKTYFGNQLDTGSSNSNTELGERFASNNDKQRTLDHLCLEASSIAKQIDTNMRNGQEK